MASDKTFYPGRLVVGLGELVLGTLGIVYVLGMTGALGIDISHYQELPGGELKRLDNTDVLGVVVGAIAAALGFLDGSRRIKRAFNY